MHLFDIIDAIGMKVISPIALAVPTIAIPTNLKYKLLIKEISRYDIIYNKVII